MPQTSIAFGRTTAQGGGVGAAWTNPANVVSPNGTTTADDNVDATVTGTLAGVTGVQTLTVSQFHLLAEETGPVFSGLKIPAGASILGLRFHHELICAGSGPSMQPSNNGDAAPGSPFTGTSRTVHTVGYGTLSAGSTNARGNTWSTQNLATEAGQAAARAELADGTATVTLTGGPGTALGTAPTYTCDYVKIEVSWVRRLDGPGGGRSSIATASGAPTALTKAPGGGRAIASRGAGQPAPVLTVPGGARSPAARSGGQPRPLGTRPGGGRAIASRGAGQPAPVLTVPGGARSPAARSGGTPTVIVQRVASGARASASRGGGQPHSLISRGPSGTRAAATAGGPARPASTAPGGARATASRGGGQPHPLSTLTGGARAAATAGAGPATIISFAIAGYGRHHTSDIPIAGVRVDVYRVSDHQHMGRVISDASGYYAVAIPGAGNEGQTFWARSRIAGSPDRFATTNDGLALITTIVQTA